MNTWSPYLHSTAKRSLFSITAVQEATFLPSEFLGDSAGGGTALDLIAAAEAGEMGKVRRLIERGVDINGQNDDEDTALHAACRNGH